MYWISQLGSTEIKKRLKSRHCPKGGGGLESAAQIEWSTFFVHWNGKKGGGSASLGPAQIFWSTFCPKIKKKYFWRKNITFWKKCSSDAQIGGQFGHPRSSFFSSSKCNNFSLNIYFYNNQFISLKSDLGQKVLLNM